MSLKSWPGSSLRSQQPSPPGANWLWGKRAEPSGPPTSGALHPPSMTLLKSTSPLHPAPGNRQATWLGLNTFCWKGDGGTWQQVISISTVCKEEQWGKGRSLQMSTLGTPQKCGPSFCLMGRTQVSKTRRTQLSCPPALLQIAWVLSHTMATSQSCPQEPGGPAAQDPPPTPVSAGVSRAVQS